MPIKKRRTVADIIAETLPPHWEVAMDNANIALFRRLVGDAARYADAHTASKLVRRAKAGHPMSVAGAGLVTTLHHVLMRDYGERLFSDDIVRALHDFLNDDDYVYGHDTAAADHWRSCALIPPKPARKRLIKHAPNKPKRRKLKKHRI